MNPKIPKIIHQTWKNNNIPKEWKKYQQTWKHHHPDWKYMFWTDNDNLNFIKKYYPWFLNIFNSYPYNIQRADAIRPFLLYHYGGLYVDMDTVCLKNFDNVFNKKGVYILESFNFGLTNSLMASSKKNIFWKYVINEMIINRNNKLYYTNHLYIMNSTGPWLITNSVKKYKYLSNIYILPTKKFNPCNTCKTKCIINKDIYSYSIHTGSWHKIDSKIFNILYCYKITIFCFFIILLLFIIRYKYN